MFYAGVAQTRSVWHNGSFPVDVSEGVQSCDLGWFWAILHVRESPPLWDFSAVTHPGSAPMVGFSDEKHEQQDAANAFGQHNAVPADQTEK